MKRSLSFLSVVFAALLLFGCASLPPAQPTFGAHVGSGHAVIGVTQRRHRYGVVQYTSTHRSNAMTDLVTAAGSTGFLMIVSGAQPATVATVDSGTVLASLPLSATAGTVSAGVLTFNAITSESASATGTAAHFLICTTSSTTNCEAVSSTTRVIQGSVGTSASDINFSSVAFTSGETISISSLTITANGA
jgi:hypothetical protein